MFLSYYLHSDHPGFTRAYATLPHQPAFAVQILGKSCMFPLADMDPVSMFQKNADIKINILPCAANAMPPARTTYHHTAVTFYFASPCGTEACGSRHDSGVVFFTVSSSSSGIGFRSFRSVLPVTGTSCKIPQSVKCVGRLAIRAFDCDHLHPYCRMIKESLRECRKCFSGILSL